MARELAGSRSLSYDVADADGELTDGLAGVQQKRHLCLPGDLADRCHRVVKLRDGLIVSQAASSYMEAGNKNLAFRAAARAEQEAKRLEKAGMLDQRTAWQLAFDGGTIFNLDDQHDQAVVYLRRCASLSAGLPDGPNAGAACRYQMSRSLAQLGRIDGAFRALASALYGTEDAQTVASITQKARTEPDLEPLRADGRWKKLIR